ncbi:MAG TPA: NupC/NupG family nucleoside CNT transporter [Saprospiraceae bacterium]|nr:NupC/NupG family nucleoside CNT transporter [Saprospiraceae bacterium]HPI06513.1 NupC/NupG family nucleoside CNT transporter [Saprospiraceae bacterium]
MDRLIGILGIVLILGTAYLLSNNRKAINYRVVGMGLLIQALLAVFILKTQVGQEIFKWLGKAVTKVLSFSDEGAKFVFGILADSPKLGQYLGPENSFIFFFRIIPTIIFVACLVNIFYHIGLMQWIVEKLAKGLNFFMKVSGAEALSNISSAFVGQVEAQIMIKPYLKGMTKSELMASMTGSFACIAGGVMATYILFGVKAEYLIAASIMAAPGALAISKIMHPETEESETRGNVKLKVGKQHSNIVDAISAGCSDGLKVGLNVLAMLVGFLALIALINYILGTVGGLAGHPEFGLNTILGGLFSGFAWAMGVPWHEAPQAGALMGTKLVANEFVAYLQLKPIIEQGALSPKTIAIVSFALCGFANFGSVGIQIGGISALEPSRRADLAKLGFRALIAGTLASYLSATLAGMLF